nr:reverse transcriptase domain-containing protein [Tanacetum cinerariifolium]
MRVPNVPNSTIKLMLFPFSLEGAARIWLEKEPPRSILTWDDLVFKFINQFFPPSKTKNLRNEITRFQQRFDESFSEAWDRFNDLHRACPHHGFSELHQLDTFYNALNVNDQGLLDSAAGGNFLDKMPSDCLKIIESKSKVRQSRAKAVVAKVNSNSSTPAISSDVAELKDMVRALLLDKKNQSSAPAPSPTLASVKAVESNYVTCGADLGASINLMPLSVWKEIALPKLTPTCMTLELADCSVSKPIGIAKDVSVKAGMFHFPADFVVVDFKLDPRVPLILGRCFLKTDCALIDVHKEANAFLSLEDDPDSPELDPSYYDPEGDIQILEPILNSDPAPSLQNHEQSVPSFTNELKACEAKTIKSSIDEPPKVELKDLPPHLEYAFLEGDNKLPVIIAKELGDEEKAALIKVLKSHKRAIAWKLSDIQEVEKLLDAGLIYPISDSPWVSPVHCVPKKGGFTVVKNEENELIPTRLVIGWR